MYAQGTHRPRGSVRVPGLRPEGIGPRPAGQRTFTLIAPLGLVRPMTRTHVGLLGPCFKTGRVDHRPTRRRARCRLPQQRGAPRSGHHVEDRRRASQDTGGSPFPPRGDGSIHPGLRRPRNGSRRPTRGEVRPWRPARKGRGLAVPGNPTCGLRSGLNPPVRPSRFHPFSSQRFHDLLNSLFKVLFNFPSRYLFAIGLVVVFSLRWSLPPALGCSFKQPDSTEGPFRAPGIGRRASHPPRVVAAFKLDLAEPGARKETLRNVASLSPPGVEVRGYTLGSSLFGRTY